MLNSSGAIIEHNGKFLLVCTRKGNWGFPKGSVEPGETVEQAAIREVKEETGLDVSIDPQRKTDVIFTTSKGRKKKITLFYAVPKTTLVKIQEKEILEYAWLTYEEVLNKVSFEDLKGAFCKIIKK